ncbi:class II glutamine amidotransferase [Aurantimonas sp. MSK8Z-1]|uniref:class II glutamine amidotransferase n=1 Tax=Mangrovibrevibacter kandeliae TaxID=2968473 RepID=UPI002118A48E|nr:class II glutamine amidotransferase [Aurantimonas sp. MSK8Z-1]MCW4115021.1 class II glutamine amidotransferase [Aurantimonas sp. MSK8Z-1]
MCRFLAYAGSPVFLDSLLIRPRSSLIAQSLAAREAKTVVNGDGCGIAWYGDREEAGLYRGILPAWSDANLVSLCRQIRSGLFCAHVRSATSGEVSTANCHPFAYGRHIFMHNGQIGGYDRLRRRIDGLIPDALYAARKGTSDSEALFLIAIAHGLERDPVEAMRLALADARAEMLAAGIADPLRFAAAHSDGETLWAYRWSSDERPPSLYWRADEGGVTVASEPCDEAAASWRPVPPGSVLAITRDGRTATFPFAPEAALPRAA